MHAHHSTFIHQCYGAHRDLHSFPTRRSSDLAVTTLGTAAVIVAVAAPPVGESDDGVVWRDEFDDQIAVVRDRKSTRLNSSHITISYAVFCLKKKKIDTFLLRVVE